MNPRTIIHLAAASIGVLDMVMKSAQTAKDWLQINQVAGDLIDGLTPIAVNDLLIPAVRESAEMYRVALRAIHRKSCQEFEALRPAGVMPSQIMAGSGVAA